MGRRPLQTETSVSVEVVELVEELVEASEAPVAPAGQCFH